jgi:glycosyltransferase involved in cell wall biosynthesis
MKSLDERLNGLRWRLRAMKRLWSAGAVPDMTFLPPHPPEHGAVGQIDRPPAAGEIGPGTFLIGGWVTFDSAPTSRCEAWLDERPLGRARLGIPRTDVGAETGMPDAGISGFELSVDPSPPLEAGPAQLRVVATAADGRSYEMGPIPVVVGADAATAEQSSPPPPVPLPTAGESRAVRMLVVTHQLNLGGAQLYLMDLLRGLAAEGGFETTVISAMDGPLREELEGMGIPVHVTSVSQQDDLSSHLGRVEELTSWMAPREFELALVNTATALVSPPAEAAARLGIPTVWAIHESFEPAVLWGHLDPEVRAGAEATLSAAAFAVFEADATLRIFEPLLGGDRCRMLPYGLDLAPIDAKRAGFDVAAARQKAGLAASKVVVCVGTVEPRKAQIPLALAFELIADRHPDAHLAFVGGREGDPYSLALEERIAASPRGSQMSLIAVTPDVDAWYGMADLLVCASDIESLPRTVLEAMAWETPVLATSVFGLPELITDGETGWLCEPRDISKLAAALDKALSTAGETHDQIARAARALVEHRHSLPNYAKEISKLLEQAREGSANEAQRRIRSG